MDKFEGQFENLDVHTAVMENSMGDAMATQTPSSQVDDLINQVPEQQLSLKKRLMELFFACFFLDKKFLL